MDEWVEFGKEFGWLPQKLLDNWIMGVKAKHEEHGWNSMPGILWDVDTMVFLGCHQCLMIMLETATKSCNSSERNEYSTYLASIVLSIECLGCDFAGWGTRYPEAKKKADGILDNYLANKRMRLLDVYMPLRSQMDQNRIRQILGPGE